LDCAIARAFLRAYPNLEEARKASLEELRAFFSQQGYTCMRKVPEIYQRLQAPAIPVADWQARVQQRHMLVLVDLLDTLVPQIQAYERELSHLLDKHQDAFIFRSLPSAGDVTAAGLLGEIGDCRAKFESASDASPGRHLSGNHTEQQKGAYQVPSCLLQAFSPCHTAIC